MRRWTTPLIVAGVVVVALLAAADALRGRSESNVVADTGSPTITRAEPPTLPEMLRREAIVGFVLYSDANCRLHSLLLPRLVDDVVRREDGTAFTQCRFTSAGGRIIEEDEVMSPDTAFLAACRDGHVAVWNADGGRPRTSYRGCPPAWRPDGRLTYPQGDRIMEGDRVLFTAQELRDAAHNHPNVAGLGTGIPIFVHATDLAWLDEDRLVASLEIRIRGVEPQGATVLFDGKAVVGFTSTFGSIPRGWVVSQAGTFAATDEGMIVERDGDFDDPPDNLPTGRAVAFSPDEQWLAYVTSVSIYLIGTPRNSEPGRIIRLPIEAQDLAWEPGGTSTTGRPTIAR
jgi:hypothetical protein